MINFDLIQAGVLVGSAPSSLDDIAHLKRLNVTALISLQSNAELIARDIDLTEMRDWYSDNSIVMHHYPINDFDEIDLGEKIGQPINALNQLLKNKQKVYVHCNAGICRAPAVVLGYLCHHEGMSFGEALRQIQIARPIASPFRSAVKKALIDLADESKPK